MVLRVCCFLSTPANKAQRPTERKKALRSMRLKTTVSKKTTVSATMLCSMLEGRAFPLHNQGEEKSEHCSAYLLKLDLLPPEGKRRRMIAPYSTGHWRLDTP